VAIIWSSPTLASRGACTRHVSADVVFCVFPILHAVGSVPFPAPETILVYLLLLLFPLSPQFYSFRDLVHVGCITDPVS